MRLTISQNTRLFLIVIAICAAEICRGKIGAFCMVDLMLRDATSQPGVQIMVLWARRYRATSTRFSCSAHASGDR